MSSDVKPKITKTFWHENYLKVYMTGFGFLCCGTANYFSRRPFFSRLPFFALYGAVGYGVGAVLERFRSRVVANRELAIWDYVERHPEDFPELKPRKFRDVLEPWNPIRSGYHIWETHGGHPYTSENLEKEKHKRIKTGFTLDP